MKRFVGPRRRSLIGARVVIKQLTIDYSLCAGQVRRVVAQRSDSVDLADPFNARRVCAHRVPFEHGGRPMFEVLPTDVRMPRSDEEHEARGPDTCVPDEFNLQALPSSLRLALARFPHIAGRRWYRFWLAPIGTDRAESTCHVFAPTWGEARGTAWVELGLNRPSVYERFALRWEGDDA